jgi:uncharacterized membrane protein YphA (DoxX/SURF4 family)
VRPATSRSSAVLPWVSTAARIGLAAVFLTAGLPKAVDSESSVAAVRAYELLPAGVATLVGWGLPFVELALGVLLLVGVATRPLALAVAALLVVFIAGVLSAAARGLSIDCGCFGGGGAVPPDQTAYAAEIARDLAFLVLAGWLVRRPVSRWSLDQRWGRAASVPGRPAEPGRSTAGPTVRTR